MIGKKVLVVDDDPDIRVFNTAVVESEGMAALVAENGEDGLDLAKTEHRY